MKTINRAFEDLRTAIELTEKQQQDAIAQHQRVRDKVASMPHFETTFLTGSYKRRTAIRPLKDIDFFVVVKEPTSWWDDQPKVAPQTLLNSLFQVLDAAWPKKEEPTQQSRSINVHFSGTDIGFDAVPAVPRTSGGYWIPDRSTETWIKTDPSKHESYLIDANRQAGDKLNPLVKMLKCWRRVLKASGQDVPFSAFHLEVMTAGFFHGWFPMSAPATWAEGVDQLLHKLVERVTSSCSEPAGLGPNLDAHWTSADRRLAKGLFESGAQAASLALRLEQTGQLEQAHQQWRALFGNDYSFRT
jgi:hypothetical protein